MKLSHLAALCLAATLAAPAVAQDQEPQEGGHHGAGMKHKMHGMHHKMVHADWVEALNLDGDKADKVRSIQQGYESNRQQLHTEHMQAMRDLKREREKQLEGVLSEEELTVLRHMWEAHSIPKSGMNYHGG